MSRRLWVLVGVVCALAPSAAGAAPMIQGCPVFPADHAWNTPITLLPVHPLSSQWIASIRADRPLHPDFGALIDPATGEPIGIPFRVVNGPPPVTITFLAFASESDLGPYPIPLDGFTPIENGPNSTGDRHVLVVDLATCILYELFRAFPQNGFWNADSGAKYNLNGYFLRQDGWTSADAAGLPIFPGLVRYDEANSGPIEHAFRFTARFTHGPHLWPARHDADTGGVTAPPMGARFRLKATVNLSGFTPRIQRIFQAMKTYGMILADNGSDWFISGEQNAAWNDNELVGAFSQLHGSDFEAVDVSSLIIDPNSGQARQPVPPTPGPRSRTFTVPPCRVLDTRFSTPPGPIPGGSARLIGVTGSLAALGQGGASNCGVPSGVTGVYANVVAVGAAGPGFLTIYPFGSALPLASTINFSTGDTVANGVLVPVCLAPVTCTSDLTIQMGPAGAHVVIDVTGYLAP